MIENAPFREVVTDSKTGLLSRGWMQWLQTVGLYAGASADSGTTANRPTTNLYVGRPYFDTTLGLPIWLKTVSPVDWVDATGASV